MEVLIYKALTDFSITFDGFFLINNILKECEIWKKK